MRGIYMRITLLHLNVLSEREGADFCAVRSVHSRAVGYRFGAHLEAAVPLVSRFCSGAGEGDEELREACLQVSSLRLHDPPHPHNRTRIICFIGTGITNLEIQGVGFSFCM